MRKALALSTIVLMMLAGCTSPSETANSWIGKSETALLADWGAPDRETATQNGRVMTFVKRNGYGVPVCRFNYVSTNGRITDANTTCAMIN